MTRSRRKIVRHERCPSCGRDIAVTRAELRARVTHCPCGTEVALAIHAADSGPGRAMQVVEARALLGPPPSLRLVEEFGDPPTLTIRRPAARPPDQLIQPPWPEVVDWLVRLRFPTVRLQVRGGVLRVRGRWGGDVSLPVGELSATTLPLDGLELRDEDLVWILAWIREQARRR